MDFKTFFKQIKDGEIKPLTLITGEEVYLIDNLIKYMTEQFLNASYLDFNLTIIDGPQDVDQIISTGMTLPFFDERRIILFQNSGLLKSMKEEQEDKFVKFIQDLPSHLVLIFNESDLDKRKKGYKALSKVADLVTVERLTRPELSKWIAKKFSGYQKDVDLHAVNYLIEMLNYLDPENNKNLYDVDNTIKMLSGVSEPITEAVINKYVEVPIENNIFKLMDAISAREMSEAITVLNHFVNNGEPEIKIFYMINQQFRNIYKTKLLLDAGYTSATVASKLELHPFVAKKAGNFALQFTVKQLRDIIVLLEETDTLMKSSGIDPLMLMEKALFQIGATKK